MSKEKEAYHERVQSMFICIPQENFLVVIKCIAQENFLVEFHWGNTLTKNQLENELERRD